MEKRLLILVVLAVSLMALGSCYSKEQEPSESSFETTHVEGKTTIVDDNREITDDSKESENQDTTEKTPEELFEISMKMKTVYSCTENAGWMGDETLEGFFETHRDKHPSILKGIVQSIEYYMQWGVKGQYGDTEYSYGMISLKVTEVSKEFTQEDIHVGDVIEVKYHMPYISFNGGRSGWLKYYYSGENESSLSIEELKEKTLGNVYPVRLEDTDEFFQNYVMVCDDQSLFLKPGEEFTMMIRKNWSFISPETYSLTDVWPVNEPEKYIEKYGNVYAKYGDPSMTYMAQLIRDYFAKQ